VYPSEELTRLALHKAKLRRKVASGRTTLGRAARRVTQPLDWADRAKRWWRQLSPYALGAVASVGFLMRRRRAQPRLKRLRAWVRWGPLAIRVVRLAGRFFWARSAVDPIQRAPS
jgi:hypothetical protein